MVVQKVAMSDDGGIRSVCAGRAFVRFGSRLVWLDATKPKPRPVEVPADRVPPLDPGCGLPDTGDPLVCGGFAGDRLYALSTGVDAPTHPPVGAAIRVFEAAAEVRRFDVPGAKWLHVDGGGRIVVHFADRAQVVSVDGAPLLDLGPAYAGPSPSGRWVAWDGNDRVVVRGEGEERTFEGRTYAWIDGDRIAVGTGDVVVRVDLTSGATTELHRGRTSRVYADPDAVWLVRDGGLADNKLARVRRVPHDGSPAEEVELPGAKSHALAATANGRLYVAVQWAKAAYVVTP